jgi:predicted RNA polymerase sigma factor
MPTTTTVTWTLPLETVTWTLPLEEHAFWLAQARECDLTVGEFIYVLASVHAAEKWPMSEAPASIQALRGAWERIRQARNRRLSRSRLHSKHREAPGHLPQ